MMKPDWQEFIIGLIQASHQTPPSRFKKETLKLLQKVVPFDMALWLSGDVAHYEVHNMYLFELPDNLMESWQNIKHQDRTLAYVVANPGKTVDAMELYRPEERRELELYKNHSKLFGIEAVVCTASPDPDLGLLEVMSLYRRKAEPGFSRDERQAKQGLFPLMSQAWRNNQILHMKNAAAGVREGAAAIVDAKGWVRQAESMFMELMRQEYPEWTPPSLPEPLLKWLESASAPEFHGSALNFFRVPQKELTLLQIQPRGLLAVLSPREEQIARSYAAGLTYKEIAKEYNLADATVRSHLESIYRKLEISNKVELIQLIG